MKKLLLIVIVLCSACSSGNGVETTLASTVTDPADVVEQWLGAIAVADVEAIEDLVEPIGLAVLAGVENSLRSEEVVAIVESGFSQALAVRYWGSFRNDFEAIRDLSISALIVGTASPVPGQSEFVTVALSSPEATGAVILRSATGVGWQVDTAATIGPAFVGPLAEYLESAMGGENAELIAAAYREGILPGLDAAVSADPENLDLAFETEFIRQLLES